MIDLLFLKVCVVVAVGVRGKNIGGWAEGGGNGNGNGSTVNQVLQYVLVLTTHWCTSTPVVLRSTA